jgi:outer membrane protein assembly factor BamB
MKNKIARNIAIISAISIVTFTIMLVTNYFQVKSGEPLRMELIENLKKLNDENANKPELQEQIRELDLMARKAYFIRQDRLMTGSIILLVMLVIFIVSVRIYFAKEKNIPDKQLDPIDDWALKSLARKYVIWVASGLGVIALVFVILTSPYLKSLMPDKLNEEQSGMASLPEEMQNTEIGEELSVLDDSIDTTLMVENINADTSAIEISKITHNGFRGNNSNGISSARKVPTKWNLNSGDNIAWKNKIPRKGYSSPVINGNKVFITGADDQARELYCYELSSGKLLWSLQAKNISGSPAQMPKTTDDTGLGASTVATNGKQVCAIFATGDIICADMDGKQLWAKNLGVPQNHYGYASSLLAFGNSLIIQYDNSNTHKVMALNMETGAERWNKTRTDKISWSSPMVAYVDKKPQLILMGNPGITSYNPNNGEQYWRVECMSGEVGSSPCSSSGTVYGASEYAKLIAIDAATGNTLWENDEYLPEVSSPVATKDNVYVATSYGVMACYNAQTGELRKSHELNTEFYSSPMIVEGKLYIFSNDGKMHIFSTNNDFNLINSFETGEKTFTTPAFTDGKIVVRTENSIYCVAGK